MRSKYNKFLYEIATPIIAAIMIIMNIIKIYILRKTTQRKESNA